MTSKLCSLMLWDGRAKFPSQEEMEAGAGLPPDSVVELPLKREFMRKFASQKGETLAGEVVLSLNLDVPLADSVAEAVSALLFYNCQIVYCADFDRIDAIGLVDRLKAALASKNVKLMRISRQAIVPQTWYRQDYRLDQLLDQLLDWCYRIFVPFD